MNEVFVTRNIVSPNYSWENFIQCINDGYSLDNEKNQKDEYREVIGKINFWQKLTLSIDWVNENNFPGIEDTSELLLKMLNDTNVSVDLKILGKFGIVSFTDKEPTTGKHHDPIDVVYCQFIGSVDWVIFKNQGKEEEHFILNPGDAIYIPKEVEHEVRSLSPRAAISFMFG
jgi:mannose-6-phosphate isomerase-like protein (cupin superfamily)